MHDLVCRNKRKWFRYTKGSKKLQNSKYTTTTDIISSFQISLSDKQYLRNQEKYSVSQDA